MPTNQEKLDGVYNNTVGASQLAFIDLICQRLLDTRINKVGGGETSQRIETAWMAANNAAVPTAVLNQPFTLADGTKTNLAGILDRINTAVSKPVTVTVDQATVTAAVAAALQANPAAVDVDALATKLAAVLPPAVLSALAAKLGQP